MMIVIDHSDVEKFSITAQIYIYDMPVALRQTGVSITVVATWIEILW
jgi:hypothetical protein